MNKKSVSGISAVIGIVILILLVLVLSAGVLFAAQTLVGDQPNQMVGGMTEERVSPYEQRVSLVSQGNANNLTIVSPLGTEYNLSQVGDSQLYLAVSSSVSGAQDPQILGVKNGERQVLTSNEIRDGIPADIVVDKHGTGGYISIRNALNDAQPGDIVVVEKATYNENIDVPKNVSLIAEHGTVIQDQNPAEPVISINNGNATVMNFIIDADPVKGDNHYASHGILVKGRNTEVIGNTIRNATSPAGDSAGLRVESDGVVARYNNFKNNEFSLSVSSGVGSVQLCSNQLDGGLHGSFSKSTYETFVMRNYWNNGVPSTVLNNVLSDRKNITATDVSRNAVNFNKVFETSNDQEILAAKAFPGTRLFGGAPCGIQLSFTNQGGSVDVVNASISYEIKNVTYNVTFNEDSTATLVRGNNSTTTSYSVSGGDTSWDTGESLSLASPDSGSSDTSGVWGSGGGGGGGASFWGGGTGGGLSGGSLFGGSGGSFWGVSSGTTSSDVKVTKSPTETNASVEQSPPENVTETEKQNVTVDLGADFKATVGDEISLDAVVTGGTSPYNYTWELGDGTTSYSKSVTHIYDATGNYTISLNVTDADGQSDTDSITVWIQESTATTTTKNESLTLNEQVSNLSPGETLVIPSGSYSSVNIDVSGVTLVGDGSVTINGLSILSDNVKVKNVEVTGPLSVTGSDYSMYDSTIDNTGGAWAIEVYETGAYFDGVTGEANNGMYVARALQDIQFTSGSLTANSGQGVLVKKHTGIVEITDSSITATGAGIYREHGSQLYLARNSISGSPNVERVLNKPPQPAFTYNDAPLDNGSYGVKFDPSSTTDPEGEPITSVKWDFNNDGIIDAYGDGVKQYEYPSYGTYNVTLSVTDYHGVTVNLKREITINEYYFAVSVSKSTINTSGTVEFNATTSVPDSNIDHYNMDYDGDGTAEEQVNSLPATYTYTTAGNYSPQIELVTTNSGTLVNSTAVKVLSPPTAKFTVNNTSPGLNESIELNASASTDPDGGVLSYEWELGDGTIKTGEIISHSYNATGDYTVKLTVTDDEGEITTSVKNISIGSSVLGPSKGLIAYYKFDGNLDDTVSSREASVVNTNSPEYTKNAVSGSAAQFDGSWQIDTKEKFEQSEFTVSAWINPNSSAAYAFCQSPTSGTYDACINFDGGDSFRGLYGGSSYSSLYSPTSVSTGQYYLVTLVNNPSSGQATLYLNGKEVDTNAAKTWSQADTTMRVGAIRNWGNSNANFVGQIDEFRMYDRALNSSEVSNLYSATSSNRLEMKTLPTVVADFEDGDIQPSSNSWTFSTTGGAVGTVETSSVSGLYSGKVSVGSGSGGRGYIAPDTPSKITEVRLLYRIVDGPDSGESMGLSLRGENEQGGPHVTFRNGGIAETNSGKQIGTFSEGETYVVKFSDIDYTANTFDIVMVRRSDNVSVVSAEDEAFSSNIDALHYLSIDNDYDNNPAEVSLIDDITVPISTFNVNKTTVNVGDSVELNASTVQSPSGETYAYEWDIDEDGTFERTGRKSTVSYTSTGEHQVSLRVTDGSRSSVVNRTVYVTSAPTNSLVAYWPLDETSGTTVKDYTRNNNYGTVENSGINLDATGKVSTGADIPGDYLSNNWRAINVGDKPEYDFSASDSFSVSFWVKVDTTRETDQMALLGKHDVQGGCFDGWAFLSNLRTSTTGGASFQFQESSCTHSYLKAENANLDDNNWHHLAGVYDASTSKAKFYVDGELRDSSSINANFGSNYPLVIGSSVMNVDSNAYMLDGTIDEVYVYNRPLTQEEISQSLYEMNAKPTAQFSINKSSTKTGEPVKFNASNSSDSDGSISSYKWDFNNDGTIDATGEKVTHTYSSIGSKTVTLNVTDSKGSSDTAKKSIDVTYSTTGTLTWGIKSDWDNAVSETGVIHEDIPNTTHTNAGKVKVGYSISQPYKSSSLVGYWPLQESNTNFAYDFSGLENDALSISGTSIGGKRLGAQSRYFAGSGSKIDLPDNSKYDIGANEDFTVAYWIRSPSYNTGSTPIGKGDSSGGVHNVWDNIWVPAGTAGAPSDEGALRATWQDNSNGAYANIRQSKLTDGDWHLVVTVTDKTNGIGYMYLDGKQQDSTDISAIGSQSNSEVIELGGPGSEPSGSSNGDFVGNLSGVRIYNRSLSASEIQTMYDISGEPSTLTTLTKSFENPRKPDLVDLSYALNGQSIKVTVIGSPGTSSEETHTVNLDGRSEYNLYWTNSHTDFRVKLNLSTSNLTKTPTVDKIQLGKITTTTIEDFESGSLSGFSGETSGFTVQSSTVQNGSYALNGDSSSIKSISNTGYNLSTPVQINVSLQVKDPGWQTFTWFAQDESGSEVNGYHFYPHTQKDTLIVNRRTSSGWTKIYSANSQVPLDEWARFSITHYTNGTITIKAYDSTGSLLQTGELTDTTYSSGGIGSRVDNGDIYIDNITAKTK